MKQMNLIEKLSELLFQNEKYTALKSNDEKVLNKTLISLQAREYNSELLTLLQKEEDIKNHFFAMVNGNLIFKLEVFLNFINNRSFLPDSFTAFKNKIGLATDKDHYIFYNNDVVLNWPYKDCILEGGQTKNEEKQDEVFYNEVLAPEKINRMFDDKVFINFKRYDKDGTHDVEKLKENDNLIIKGNNLIVLHSLKKRFHGNVKLIYIDPPYNTQTNANTFGYNNNFNHSTWLTFMKNRLEVARELLKDNGIFACAIDHYELFYLGVLMDEIFGRENRLGVIAVVHNPGGRQDDKFFPTAHENMIVYAKNKELAEVYLLEKSSEKLKEFKLSDKYGKYKLRGLRRSGNNSNREDGPGLYYPIYFDPDTLNISLENKKGFIEILPIDDNGTEKCWRWGKETFLSKMKKYIEIKEVNGKYDIYVKERESDY